MRTTYTARCLLSRWLAPVLGIALLLLGKFDTAIFAAPLPMPTMQAAFACADVSQIPQIECQALVALYNSTNGAQWLNKTNWLVTPTPCSWFGVICSGIHVRRLALSTNKLSGAIPTEIGQLTGLQALELSFNQLAGTLPPQLGDLLNLQILQLHANQLSGNIPPELGKLVNLQKLFLRTNRLTGSMPPELGNLTNLVEFRLSDNQLSGSIPPELGNLTNLQILRLGTNHLSGVIPAELGNLANLQELSLSENQLSGEVPAQLDNLVNLQELDLSSNQLSGALSPQWGHLLNLQRLYLQTNQITGSIPTDLGKLTNLQKLYLSFNQLSGQIPTQFSNLTNLQDLFLAHNQLTGTVPSALGNLTSVITLTLGANQLNGPLPASLTNLHNITSLQFGYTDLCEPRNAQFQAWLQGIPNVISSHISCAPETGDVYEDKGDNDCAQATLITSDGEAQPHNFHKAADDDWVRFDAIQGARYRIEALIPPDSTADVAIELYATCNTLSETQAYTFTPDVRLEFTAPSKGLYFLRLTDPVSDVYGTKAKYSLAVRALNTTPPATTSAAIIVAGSLGPNDSAVTNIYHASDAMRQLFIQQGYATDHIAYLAPDTNHLNVDKASTKANLQEAITQWAVNLVGDNGALTLYIIDHGSPEQRIYLNKPQNEWMMPADLDAWLTTFETAHPNAKVNVMIEACYGGAFIRHAHTTGKNNRVVITSTTDQALAWASANGGAQFSDHLLDALSRKNSLFASFQVGQAAAHAFQPSQLAWLDANGNTIPNEPEDYAIASQRGFEVVGSLAENWPPYVQQANAVNNLVRAIIVDDQAVTHVWAMIYPPEYSAPITGEALVRDTDDLRITQLGLLPRSDGSYSANFAFTNPGDYRVVIYAEDNQGFEAQPVTVAVTVNPSQQSFLPLVVR